MGVDFNNTITSFEGGFDRADRYAMRYFTIVAKNGQESLANIWIFPFFDDAAPRPPYSQRHLVFHLAGDKTAMAPGAPPQINYHRKSSSF
jgi:hypothetical protein